MRCVALPGRACVVASETFFPNVMTRPPGGNVHTREQKQANVTWALIAQGMGCQDRINDARLAESSGAWVRL